MSIHIYVYVYLCIYVSMYAGIYVNMDISIHVFYLHVFYIYTCKAVSRKHQVEYLGAKVRDSVDNHREVLKRMGQASATASQLQLCWNKARTAIKWKRQVANSKLLYGLETVQLTQSEQNRIDAFQMKMLKRILRVPPTHIGRSWTNQKVTDRLTEGQSSRSGR